MNAKQKEAIERIKEKNGGELPSELYLMTNEQLLKMVFDLTGKMPSARTSKTALVTKIESLSKPSAKKASTKKAEPEKKATPAKKRKLSEKADSDSEPIVEEKKQPKKKQTATKPDADVKAEKKVPRGTLKTLTSAQRAEMKRVLALSAEDMEATHTHKELTPIWERIGMTSKYPYMSPKKTVIARLREFAEKNLKHQYSQLL